MVSKVFDHGESICCSRFLSFAQESEMNFVLYPFCVSRYKKPDRDSRHIHGGVQDYGFYGSSVGCNAMGCGVWSTTECCVGCGASLCIE
jgi:hypothetical protein